MKGQTTQQDCNVCFMDMRGASLLSPEDAKQFQFVIFGGILGDHPPKDRAGDFRANFSNVRSLGPVQMTTDTALLVSREILEEGKQLEKLKFTTDPEIPTDNSVKKYLDIRMPLLNIIEDSFKFSEHTTLKSFREQALTDVEEFSKAMKAQTMDNNSDEGDREEFTVMEGFRYRVNGDVLYPVFRGKEELKEFPIIPIGMLDIWRSENEEEFNF